MVLFAEVRAPFPATTGLVLAASLRRAASHLPKQKRLIAPTRYAMSPQGATTNGRSLLCFAPALETVFPSASATNASRTATATLSSGVHQRPAGAAEAARAAAHALMSFDDADDNATPVRAPAPPAPPSR